MTDRMTALKATLAHHEAQMVECDTAGRLADGSYHWQQAAVIRAEIAQAEAPDFVAAVKAHALAHYNKSGWDIIVECWSDAEIAEAIQGAKTAKGAIAKVAKTVKLLGDYRSDIQNA